MRIRQQLVTGSARLVIAGTNPARWITIHETANTSVGANAAAHANLQSRGNSRTASWHWQVDDREAVQSYLATDRCMHAGDGAGTGNYSSIAIEICVNSDGSFPQAVLNAAELTATLMRDHDIPISQVVQHNHWSGKNCPAGIRAGRDSYNWAKFSYQVTKAFNALDPAKSGDTPTPNPIQPKDEDMLILTAPNRTATLVGPGYQFTLEDESLAVMKGVGIPAHAVNDRQFDVALAACTHGERTGQLTAEDIKTAVVAAMQGAVPVEGSSVESLVAAITAQLGSALTDGLTVTGTMQGMVAL